MSKTPALDWVLRTVSVDYGPDGWTCDGCPFALAGPCGDQSLTFPFNRYPGEGFNSNTDRSEAWFKCGLPDSATSAEPSIWGEYPACTHDEWVRQARKELEQFVD